MEITITVNGEKVRAEIDDRDIAKITGKKPEKRTGYEPMEEGYCVTEGGEISDELYPGGGCKNSPEYIAGNFYSLKKVAENNARADALMRQLRRFAAEHGGCRKPEENGWEIAADSFKGTIFPKRIDDIIPAGTVCFSSNESAYTAITQYYDELNWYFTDYDPMPEGWWDKD